MQRPTTATPAFGLSSTARAEGIEPTYHCFKGSWLPVSRRPSDIVEDVPRKSVLWESNPPNRIGSPEPLPLGQGHMRKYEERRVKCESCGGRNRTCVCAVNSRDPVPTQDPPHRGLNQTSNFPLETSKKRPVGVEPTLPPWQGSRLPLHHGRKIASQPNC